MAGWSVWSQSSWFETVAEAQRRAQRRLPPSVYKALLAGSERGVSYEDNLTAFGELGISPTSPATGPHVTSRRP